MDVLQKQINPNLTAAQEGYKQNFDRTAQCMQHFYSGQSVFADRAPVQHFASMCMANATLTKLLPKTLGPFGVISAAPSTATEDEIEIHITVSIGRVMLVSYNAQGNGQAYQDCNTQNASN